MYYIDQIKCTFCGGCSSICPVTAIEVTDNSSSITRNCIECGNCASFCPIEAIDEIENELMDENLVAVA